MMMLSMHSMREFLMRFNILKKIVGKIGCKVIDVTNKAVEETANTIIEHILTCK